MSCRGFSLAAGAGVDVTAVAPVATQEATPGRGLTVACIAAAAKEVVVAVVAQSPPAVAAVAIVVVVTEEAAASGARPEAGSDACLLPATDSTVAEAVAAVAKLAACGVCTPGSMGATSAAVVAGTEAWVKLGAVGVLTQHCLRRHHKNDIECWP